jgi:hypothetical protein
MARRRARDLQKEARWRKVVATQRRSGHSVRQYCQENDLPESAFWFWKRELARRDAEKPALRAGGQSSSRRTGRQRSPLPSLVPVTIGAALSTPLEISFAHGVNVRVGSGCDEALLQVVLRALESRS